jgi:flagellin
MCFALRIIRIFLLKMTAVKRCKDIRVHFDSIETLTRLFLEVLKLFLKIFGGNMALVINTNLGSINGQRNLSTTASAQATAMTRLSSGIRVNSAKDDAAGLAIADRMNSQIRGMTVAVRNANDGISLTQTAEGALGSLTDTLQRMRDLAVQSSSNAGVSASDRSKMQTEFKALNDELLRVVANSEFNGKKILNGDLAGGLNIQVGATTDTNSRIAVAVSNMSAILNPVTRTTLYPKGEPIDSTLAAEVTNSGVLAANDPQLNASNEAAKAANAAVTAAKLAIASPNDAALAKEASRLNKIAADAIAASSANIFTTTNGGTPAAAPNTAAIAGVGGLLGSKLVSNAFSNTVTAAYDANFSASLAIAQTDAAINGIDGVGGIVSSDAAQAASLMTTATQLAAAASADVSFAGQNVFASTMNSLTGDNLSVVDSTGQSNSTLNLSVSRYENGTFGADRNAQKALAAAEIAKSIAAASYIDEPTKTETANSTDKLSFINNNKLVVDTSIATDAVATDYALSSINAIDDAIASIDTERSNLGSTQNRFTTTISNLQNGIENQSAAKSRILDADFAQETAALARSQILQQAGTAMLAQANQAGQSVMTLLR